MRCMAPAGLLLVAGLCLSTVAEAATPAEAPLCRLGKKQSPVDISAEAQQHARKGLPALNVAYQSEPLRLAHDGHTLRVRFAKGGELRIGSERYALQQFHFHTPGGDRIAGEAFPFAAHLLHKSRSGQLLALVVLFRQGAENPALAALLPHIPSKADGDHRIAGAMADASALLPANRAYYRYEGSLTATPCTEGVTWLVLKQPLELSSAQLKQWQAHFADNIRGPQSLNGRVVGEGS